MDFFELTTIYDWERCFYKIKDPWKDFYKARTLEAARIYDQTRDHAALIGVNQLISESRWYHEGKPYYKVWPQIVDEFIRTPIDINSNLLHPPHDAFLIRLPKDPILSFDTPEGSHCVQTILVFKSEKTIDPEGEEITDKEEPGFIIWINVGEKFEFPDIKGKPISCFVNVAFKPDKTIEECVRHTIRSTDEEDGGITVPASIIEAAIRLTVGVCFLGTGSHKILEYDVLADLLDKYRQLDEASPERKRIEDKSARRGKCGWNIGRGLADRYLKLPRGVSYEEALRTAGSRELLYQHTRGRHWRELKPGPDKPWKKHQVVFIDEIVVRKDLPPKPLN